MDVSRDYRNDNGLSVLYGFRYRCEKIVELNYRKFLEIRTRESIREGLFFCFFMILSFNQYFRFQKGAESCVTYDGKFLFKDVSRVGTGALYSGGGRVNLGECRCLTRAWKRGPKSQ